MTYSPGVLTLLPCSGWCVLGVSTIELLFVPFHALFQVQALLGVRGTKLPCRREEYLPSQEEFLSMATDAPHQQFFKSLVMWMVEAKGRGQLAHDWKSCHPSILKIH